MNMEGKYKIIIVSGVCALAGAVLLVSLSEKTKGHEEDLVVKTDGLSIEGTTTTLFDEYLEKGRTSFRGGDFTASLSWYQKALEINKSHEVYDLIYNTRLGLRDLIGARDAIKQARDLRPDLARYWVLLTQIESELGASKVEISKTYRDGMGVVSDSLVDIVTAYAEYLESVGDNRGAIAMWQKAITLLPEKKDVYNDQIKRLQKI